MEWSPAQPLWLDTFDVGPGEVWEVALYADNPGIWMDHCHNLEHAALGMVTHLAYRDVTTPFEHGGPAGNAPNDRGVEASMTEQLRIWAGLQGFISAASLIALLLFFGLATPFGNEQRQWSWLGPVNDWLSVLGAVPWIVASVLLALRVRAPWWFWALTVLLAIAVLAAALVTVLMLAGRASLQLQFAFAIAHDRHLLPVARLRGRSRHEVGGAAGVDGRLRRRDRRRIRAGCGDRRSRVRRSGGDGLADAAPDHRCRARFPGDDRLPGVVDLRRLDGSVTAGHRGRMLSAAAARLGASLIRRRNRQ